MRQHLLLMLAAAPAVAQIIPGDLWDSVRTHVLAPNRLEAPDLRLAPESESRDPHRLRASELILRDPGKLPAFVDEVRKIELAIPKGQGSRMISPLALWPLIDQPASLQELDDTANVDLGKELDFIDSHLQDFLGALDTSEREFLFSKAPGLFQMSRADTTLNPWEQERERLSTEQDAHRVYELAARLRTDHLVVASQLAWRLQQILSRELQRGRYHEAIRILKKTRVARRIPIHVDGGEVNRHIVKRGIYIDLEGDDEWVFSKDIKPGDFIMIIDMKGNDRYISQDTTGSVPGNLGMFFLSDLKGDDEYIGGDFGFASALMGVSMLYDGEGDDRYWGRCGAQGFGFFGLGVLQDASGNDTYQASLLSQGASSTAGLGLLLDESGFDQYLARPTFADDLRYRDHSIHMMQGFSTGMLPDYSGGLGILWDKEGSDTYVSDIFGQGAGYWYGIGLLLDDAGNDRYQAHQYAQGAGIHLAVGALIDASGDDSYFSKGVSQGCGHDYAFGALLDLAGNDTYVATDMSQGAGSANGFGLLADADGNDGYLGLNPDMTLGHADMRRDRPSLGVFYDGGGEDRFSSPGKEKRKAWSVIGQVLAPGKKKGQGLGRNR